MRYVTSYLRLVTSTVPAVDLKAAVHAHQNPYRQEQREAHHVQWQESRGLSVVATAAAVESRRATETAAPDTEIKKVLTSMTQIACGKLHTLISVFTSEKFT
mmetsp:Transcript_11331/g.26970  ORF Transcript_11331/g.26970 Transcript_11331/m.26970 type:complete len:102 (+) Transcript_11331:316-621(+)